MALWLVLEWYGATSEVSWLFLLAAWVLAFIALCFGYALWNRAGLRLHLAAAATRPGELSPSHDLPEHVLRTGPLPAPIFEGDDLSVEVGLNTAGSSRGPAWVAGSVAGSDVIFGTGLVPTTGWRRTKVLPGVRRGSVGATRWRIGSSDPLGFFRGTRACPDIEVALVLPRFGSLAGRGPARELEASLVAPRAGSGTELFGIREYRPGDSLRRIHWRSSARHGELVVREYEPPGAKTLGLFLDPAPATVDVADQVARIAASEAWDCIREGGRVTLWAPGLQATEPAQGRDLWAVLEWLARYPGAPADEPPPPVTEAVMVSGTPDARLVEAVESARRRGARTRGWIVGEADVDLDAAVERVGVGWPL